MSRLLSLKMATDLNENVFVNVVYKVEILFSQVLEHKKIIIENQNREIRNFWLDKDNEVSNLRMSTSKELGL